MCYNLEGINFYGDYSLSQLLRDNLITYLKYGFLELGAFYNISVGQQNYRGVDVSQLRPLNVTGITPYTVYRGLKHDWVWESNISLKYTSGSQPLAATGITVNGTPMGSGHYIDYSRGQVVFDSALNSATTVKAQYCVRGVQVYPAEGPEYRDLTYGWQNITNSGAINDIQEKGYLPAIFVDVTDLRTVRGTEIGSRGKFVNATIRFDVFAANDYELRKLLDVLYMLETKHITLYDAQNSPRPLDSRGRLTNPTGTYPALLHNHSIGTARFDDNASMLKIRNSNLPIYKGIVEIGLEFDAYPT